MEWDRWKKLTVKVRLRIIYIYFIYIFHNQSVIVIIHYMTCKTLSDTDGQMDHGEAKLTANLQSVWTTTRQVMAITRTLQTQDEYQGSGSCYHL